MMRLFRGLLVFVFVLILAVLGGFIYLRSSLPKVRGTLDLPGLSNTVEVVRDRYAVPHIYAQTPQDAYFALGFVHAQDRLWQMEFQRRVGAGRLSEVLGEATRPTDTFLRTLGVYRHAEKALGAFSPETLATLDAYVSGINTFLDTRRGALPPEFLVLGFEPEPWTLADVVVWTKMMAYDLSGNWRDEVLRARLAQVLSSEQIAELWPPYPEDAPVALPDFTALYRELDFAGVWAGSLDGLVAGAGSNNWVVGGARTESGSPLLANDPHLGLQAPSLWYFAHLSAPGLEVIGATLPGTPSVLLGRNERVAWGFTNTGPDVQDTFIEQVNPENPAQYLTPDGYQDFTERQETVKVKDADDVVLNVRETRHGPVISDVNAASASAVEGAGDDTNDTYVLALSWTALQDEDLTLQAGLELNKAQDWDEFVAALKNFKVPQQNIVYADTSGDIGYYAPAKVPVRAAGDGLAPVPGWTGEYDWTGYIPFEDLPHAYDPPNAQVVTANNRIVPESYPYFLTTDWAPPYRAERIGELLAQTQKHTVSSFTQIQADQLDAMSLDFLPLLLGVEPTTETGRAALAKLRDWDGAMRADLSEPLLFWAWYRALVRLVLSDDLGEQFSDYYGVRSQFMLSAIAGSPKTDWCDDTRTPDRESCEDLAAQALSDGLEYLTETYGTNPEEWRWGAAHVAHMDHAVMTNTPLAPLFDLSIEVGGSANSVNVGSFSLGSSAPFRDNHGPGYRAVYDLSDLGKSLYVHSTGQSGNPLSRHYRDFLAKWRDVEYLPMTTNRTEIESGAVGALKLLPKGK